MPVSNAKSFWLEARFQRVCALCGKSGLFHAHHVVYEQELRRVLGVPKKHPSLYDTRNALRVCEERVNNCHFRHHNHIEVIRTEKLTDDNIAYAFEVLGLYGADYLRDKYDDAARDPRILELESRHQEATT